MTNNRKQRRATKAVERKAEPVAAPNGQPAQLPEGADPRKQTILAGAVVPLTDTVIEYGILFHHPELPPFKLMFSLDLANKKVTHVFNICEKERPEVEHFVVDLVTAMVEKPKSSIIMPDTGIVGP